MDIEETTNNGPKTLLSTVTKKLPNVVPINGIKTETKVIKKTFGTVNGIKTEKKLPNVVPLTVSVAKKLNGIKTETKVVKKETTTVKKVKKEEEEEPEKEEKKIIKKRKREDDTEEEEKGQSKTKQSKFQKMVSLSFSLFIVINLCLLLI